MIISYEMRSVSPHGNLTPWVEMCGSFDSMEAFERFKARESDNGREVRRAWYTVASDRPRREPAAPSVQYEQRRRRRMLRRLHGAVDMIHEMQSDELVYVREPTSGRMFRVLAIATQADANAYMARHTDTGVVFATDSVAYIARLNDSGRVLA